jgi:hypothetical protein
MQGIPPKYLEDYIPLLANSLEGSLEGAVNNEVASKIGTSTPLEESIPSINPLLSVAQDPHFLWINSSGDLVVDEYIEVPIGPNAKSSADDPLFQSESFRTLVHTTRIFNPSFAPFHYFWRSSSGHDIFDKLGMIPNQPMASRMSVVSTTYTIPLDHFTGTTSNVIMVSY